LVNVTATVTDRSGRFVPGLTLNDFIVHEDDRPVEVTHFSADRVPVTLGIVLDTSGSMAGEKIVNARAAIERSRFNSSIQKTKYFCMASRAMSN
jgi:Ca-activated chloride channel homolog